MPASDATQPASGLLHTREPSQSESRLLCLVCMLIGVFITLCLFVFYF